MAFNSGVCTGGEGCQEHPVGDHFLAPEFGTPVFARSCSLQTSKVKKSGRRLPNQGPPWQSSLAIFVLEAPRSGGRDHFGRFPCRRVSPFRGPAGDRVSAAVR